MNDGQGMTPFRHIDTPLGPIIDQWLNAYFLFVLTVLRYAVCYADLK
jgi:hypothetical protein